MKTKSQAEHEETTNNALEKLRIAIMEESVAEMMACFNADGSDDEHFQASIHLDAETGVELEFQPTTEHERRSLFRSWGEVLKHNSKEDLIALSLLFQRAAEKCL